MSAIEQLLRETYQPALRELFKPGVMFDLIRAELDEAKRKDDEWLASLSERDRRAELIRRRIQRCEERLAAALDFRRYDDEW